MNSVNLIGRLTSNPVLTELENDYVVVKFNLAVEKTLSVEKKEKLMEEGKAVANFPRIQAWGRQARLVEEYLSKGKMIGVEGEIQTDVYENTEGEVKYSTVINAHSIKFL